MTEKKVLSSGEQSIEAFVAWQSTMTADDYRQITFRGSLNRGEIAKGCGFAKSVLQQNPEVKRLLEKLEESLRQQKVLPELTDDAKTAAKQPKQYDKTASKRGRESKRVSELEQEVLELKARLRRYSELSEVLDEMGISV